jgi:hypothetical protein
VGPYRRLPPPLTFAAPDAPGKGSGRDVAEVAYEAEGAVVDVDSLSVLSCTSVATRWDVDIEGPWSLYRRLQKGRKAG